MTSLAKQKRSDWMQRAVAVHKQIQDCERKQVYSTRGRAIFAANRVTAPIRLNPYRCNICGHWHLTKQTPPAFEGRE